MKSYRQKLNLAPKIITILLLAGTALLFLIGMIRDIVGMHCSGFMGIKTSCIEETIVWPYGFIAFPLIFIFGGWWLVVSSTR